MASFPKLWSALMQMRGAVLETSGLRRERYSVEPRAEDFKVCQVDEWPPGTETGGRAHPGLPFRMGTGSGWRVSRESNARSLVHGVLRGGQNARRKQRPKPGEHLQRAKIASASLVAPLAGRVVAGRERRVGPLGALHQHVADWNPAGRPFCSGGVRWRSQFERAVVFESCMRACVANSSRKWQAKPGTGASAARPAKVPSDIPK